VNEKNMLKSIFAGFSLLTAISLFTAVFAKDVLETNPE
jgi:hypothetical protein